MGLLAREKEFSRRKKFSCLGQSHRCMLPGRCSEERFSTNLYVKNSSGLYEFSPGGPGETGTDGRHFPFSEIFDRKDDRADSGNVCRANPVHSRGTAGADASAGSA